MHGHLNRSHYEEYKEHNFDMEQLTEGYTRRSPAENHKKRGEKKEMAEKKDLKNDKPKNLRLLNKSRPAELEAYNEGYRYLDPDEMIAYTSAEVKEEGWIT